MGGTPSGTLRAIAKGLGSLASETGDSYALRASERATQIYLDCLLLQHANRASRDESVIIQFALLRIFSPRSRASNRINEHVVHVRNVGKWFDFAHTLALYPLCIWGRL